MTTDKNKNEQDYILSFSFCGIVPYLQKFFFLLVLSCFGRTVIYPFMYLFIYCVAAVSQ